MTRTLSSFTAKQRRFNPLRFAFKVASSARMYTALSFSSKSYFASGSRAGASSMSPVATLKQAGEHEKTKNSRHCSSITSMPRTSQPSFWCDHSQFQRSAIVRTIGASRMDFALYLHEEHLGEMSVERKQGNGCNKPCRFQRLRPRSPSSLPLSGQERQCP
jgi:hypothetical protein